MDWFRSVRSASGRRWLVVGGGVLGVCALAVLAVVGYALSLVPDLPSLREVRAPSLELATTLYTADGEPLGRLYREHRVWVGLDAVAPAVVDALLATEDHRFYDHGGVDVVRTLGSAWHTLRGRRQGASTITMQLARNLFPDLKEAPPAERKLKEMMTAFKLERHYDKQAILEMYLNTVPFGHNAFGIEAAAETYFGKPARALDVAEAATLVGMLKGPTRYNPRRHPERAWARRNVVLSLMVGHGMLEAALYEQIRQEAIALQFGRPSRADGLAPHFAEHVRARLEDWAGNARLDPYASGLRVYTTLDAGLQRAAVAAVAEEADALQAIAGYEWSRPAPDLLSTDPGPYLDARAAGRTDAFGYLWRTRRDLVDQYVRQTPRFRQALRRGEAPEEALTRLRSDTAFMDSLRAVRTRLEAGLVALDPQTGAVRAWVGGRDFALDQYDKVALARRQPGSTFKPFVYAAAVDLGFSPYYAFRDSVVSYQGWHGDEAWRPTNAGGFGTGDTLTLRDALAFSKNTVTAQLMAEVGPYQVARVARSLGITSPLARVPSLALGTSEVTLLELTAAYATLAALGQRHTPFAIARIEDRHGRILATFEGDDRKVFSSYTAYTVVDMLRGTVDRGTGRTLRAAYGLGEYDLAGKTGTSQHNADGWFVAMHPHLVVGTWVGFNDRRLAFRTSHWGQGGHNALRLAGGFLQRALASPAMERTAPARFRPPTGYRTPQPSDVAGSPYLAEPFDRSAQPHLRNAQAEGLVRDTVRRRIVFDADGSRRVETVAPPAEADVEQALRRALADTLRYRRLDGQETDDQVPEVDAQVIRDQ